MAVNDPLGDMLTRIRNAQMRRKGKVQTPAPSFARMCSMFCIRKAISAAIRRRNTAMAAPSSKSSSNISTVFR